MKTIRPITENSNKYTYPKNISDWIETIELVGLFKPNLTEFKQTLKCLIKNERDYYLSLNENELIIENCKEKHVFKYEYLFRHYKLLKANIKYIINIRVLSHILLNIDNEKFGDKDAMLMIENNIIRCTGYEENFIEDSVELGHVKNNISNEKYTSLSEWLIKTLDYELDVWRDIPYDEQLYIRRIV